MSNGPSTQDTIHEAFKKLKEQSNAKEIELIELLTKIYDELKEKHNHIEELHSSVHEHPWPYIGGSALCGFLLGFFCGNRFKK